MPDHKASDRIEASRPFVGVPDVLRDSPGFTRSTSPGFTRSTIRSREKAAQLTVLAFVGDGLVLIGTLCGVLVARLHLPPLGFGIADVSDVVDYQKYIILPAALFLGMLVYGNLYDSRNILRFRLVTIKIARWSFAWIGCVLLTAFIIKLDPPISRIFFIMALITTPPSLIGWRSLFHFLILRSAKHRALQQRVAFVGCSGEVARLVRHFQGDPECAYIAIGYFRTSDEIGELSVNVPWLGTLDDVEDALVSSTIDVVVLDDSTCSRDQVLRLAELCEREMVTFKVVASYFQILLSGLQCETIGGVSILGVDQLSLDHVVNRALKRSLDILGAMVGLALAVPIVAICGACVYIESPGPILYRQRRLGRNGKTFDICKIRSMRLDAESNGQPGWTVPNDPRRLRVGAWLRKWNLDEVPQFWNVLMGDMSLVGPRPERPELIAVLKHEISHYNARHNTKPGMTGWAQVNGLRGDTDLTERVKYDLWYLEHWSVLLDIQIILMTFWKFSAAG